MRWWGILAFAASCYRAPAPDACTITCDTTCPDGLTCDRGLCVAPGQVCRPHLASLSVGTGFSCGLDVDRALWCWGSNKHHQIDPDDRIVQVPRAQRIGGDRRWEVYSAGGEHACGIIDGSLFCWGSNDHGQTSRPAVPGDNVVPILVEFSGAPSRWTAVSAGDASTCAIGDGKLYCWGHNISGSLGTGDTNDSNLPPSPVTTAIADWTSVSVGPTHTCAISESAGVVCFGRDDNGEVGPNATANPQTTPVVALAQPVSAVAVTTSATCAIANGALQCWGSNAHGELGEKNRAVANSAMPLLATAVTGWISVDGEVDKLCGLAGSDAYCWGAESNGALGNGVWSDTQQFAKVTSGASAVSVGWSQPGLEHACAIIDGDAVCWGDNRFGQLGRGVATMALVPTTVDGEHTWRGLAVGEHHACGIDDNALYCWGSTLDGQTFGMSTGTTSPRIPCTLGADCDVGTPKEIGFVPGATAVATGSAHTCALAGGVITCWGANNARQLGTAQAGPLRRTVSAPGGVAWAALLPTGFQGQCANPAGTGVACWGTVIGSATAPRVEAMLAGVHEISIGERFGCIRDSGDKLSCLGANDRGQFGNGMCANCTSPMLMPLDRPYRAISVSARGEFACGVRPDGAVECWGTNHRGQTSAVDAANALVDPTFTPSLVPGLTGCTAVAAGMEHACAICSGRIVCWGDDRVGQLGTGPLADAPVPVPRPLDPLIDDAWSELHAGADFTCALSMKGVAACWGFDPRAAVGNGATAANLPVPVQSVPIPAH